MSGIISGGFEVLAHLNCKHQSQTNLNFLFSITLYFLQDVAAYIKKEFDKKHNPTW